MKLFSVDAMLPFDEGIHGTVSIAFQAETIEEAFEMVKSLYGDVINPEYAPEIFRVEELEEEE